MIKAAQNCFLADICNPTSNAKVTGVITSLYPIKKSKGNVSYFDGEISDGKACQDFLALIHLSKEKYVDEIDGPLTL